MTTKKPQDPHLLQIKELITHCESEVDYAEQCLSKAKKQHHEALQSLQNYYRKEDDKFPLVQSIRQSKFCRDRRVDSFVILRQTPSGKLVCRKYGLPESEAIQYALSKYRDIFVQVGPSKGYSSYLKSELEGVPQEYIDRAKEAAKK